MFPSLKHRLIISLAWALSLAMWLWVRPGLEAASGEPGLSLFAARVEILAALGLAILAGLPSMVLGVLTSVTGNPLAGVFASAAALGVVAWLGGPIDGWMRQSHLPAAYGWLILELLIWFAGVVLMLVAIEWFRSPMRVKWPALAFTDHLGVDTQMRLPQAQALGAGAVCAVAGGILSHVLIRNSDPEQVVWSLVCAFTLAGLVGHLVFPQSNPVGMLLAPAIVAAGAYAYVRFFYQSDTQIWADFHAGRLTGLALALPIHYASAGVAGVTLGIGWAQGWEVARGNSSTDTKEAAKA